MNNIKTKPFNLEEAKAGKPIVTREGNPARVLCFDKKGMYPVIALVDFGDIEEALSYDLEGKGGYGSSLLMKVETKTMYIRPFRNNYKNIQTMTSNVKGGALTNSHLNWCGDIVEIQVEV